MEGSISRLKNQARSLAVAQEELFELLAKEACSNCCQEYLGGNKDCPPPPKTIEAN